MQMSKANHSLPAFACAAENGHQAGMSLRDYFASHAMQGLMNVWITTKEVYDWQNHVAETAYKMADEMLKAREEKSDG